MVKGFEVTDDWYTMCQNNPDLRDAIMAECGCIEAPWTDDQVASLNAFQASDHVHPFTGSQGASLRATAAGWVEHVGGPVVQKWALTFMADWSWRKLESSVKAVAR
jgi:hypothetical protein